MDTDLITSCHRRIAAAEALLAATPVHLHTNALQGALALANGDLRQAITQLEALLRYCDECEKAERTWRNRHDTILASLPLGVLLTSSTGDVAAANTVCAELLNASGRDLTGTSMLLYLRHRHEWTGALRCLRGFGRTVRVATSIMSGGSTPMLASITRVDDSTLLWVFLPAGTCEASQHWAGENAVSL